MTSINSMRFMMWIQFAALGLTAALLFGSPPAGAGDSIPDKPFDVQSGVIEMKKTVKNSAVTSETAETLYWKDFGRVQARYSTEKTSNKYIKGEQITRKFSLLEGKTLTSVDLDTKKGTRMENPVSGMLGKMSRQDAQDMADKMGEAMNTTTKKVGEEQVAGKLCEVYEAVTKMGAVKQTTRTCLWKNIVLKLVSSGMGTEVIEEALSVKTDAPVSAEKFKIPEGAAVMDIGNPLRGKGRKMK